MTGIWGHGLWDWTSGRGFASRGQSWVQRSSGTPASVKVELHPQMWVDMASGAPPPSHVTDVNLVKGFCFNGGQEGRRWEGGD